MKRCQLHVFTSNYLEGWGAVVSEAMNSGCCVVANRQIGAVPFLIEDGVNGKSYPDGSYEAFERTVLELCAQPEQITALGKRHTGRLQKMECRMCGAALPGIL